MLEENEKLSKENYDLHKSNTQFEEFLRVK